MLTLFFACGTSAIQDGWKENGVEVIKDSYVSTFLIQGNAGSNVLIDAGGDKKASAIKERLKTYDLDAENITQLLFTHGHTDHLAGTDQFTNATTYAIEEEHSKILEEDIKIDESLYDGQSLAFDDIEILPLHVEGHTPGNAVFVINKVLIMGDTASSSDKGEIIPSPSFFNEDDPLAKQAIADLYTRIKQEEIEIEWIVFSHSGPLQGLDALSRYTP